MNFFSKQELRALVVIFGLLVVVSLPNFIVSLRRARDAQRRADIGSIQGAIFRYQEDFGTYPLSINGKIAACEPVSYKDVGGIKHPIFSACEYGKSSLSDLSDGSYPAYMKIIPNDPDTGRKTIYYYFSSGSRFQIYGSLEGKDEAEYDINIVGRGVFCGEELCNFGKSSGTTPLDMSIEDYESTIKK